MVSRFCVVQVIFGRKGDDITGVEVLVFAVSCEVAALLKTCAIENCNRLL